VDSETTLVAYGPVVEILAGQINILGQEFDLSELELDEAFLGDVLGKSGYVEGIVADGSIIATSLIIFDAYAVPGATPVFISGVVTSAPDELGRAYIGSIAIDVTTVGGTPVRVGDSVAVTGTQPLLQGMILGESMITLSGDMEEGAHSLQFVRSITGSSQR
jgi:hypothetical protein